MKVWALLLAAGEGKRMGCGKLTLEFGRSTVVRTVAEVLLGVPVGGLTVVVGHHADSIRDALAGLPCEFVENPDPEQGMLSSVQAGLRSLPSEAEAFLLALGDQPEISSAAIRALLHASRSSTRWMFIPEFGGRRGHPVLFRAEAVPSILALPRSVGLNVWRNAHPDRIQPVPVDRPEILNDVDTPEDYAAALARRSRLDED